MCDIVRSSAMGDIVVTPRPASADPRPNFVAGRPERMLAGSRGLRPAEPTPRRFPRPNDDTPSISTSDRGFQDSSRADLFSSLLPQGASTLRITSFLSAVAQSSTGIVAPMAKRESAWELPEALAARKGQQRDR